MNASKLIQVFSAMLRLAVMDDETWEWLKELRGEEPGPTPDPIPDPVPDDPTYDSRLVLGKASEEELLRGAIVEDLVRIVLKQISTL